MRAYYLLLVVAVSVALAASSEFAEADASNGAPDKVKEVPGKVKDAAVVVADKVKQLPGKFVGGLRTAAVGVVGNLRGAASAVSHRFGRADAERSADAVEAMAIQRENLAGEGAADSATALAEDEQQTQQQQDSVAGERAVDSATALAEDKQQTQQQQDSVSKPSGEPPAPTFTWSLCGKTMLQNFGGLGPDEGASELRYYSVGAWEGKTVDLVLLNTSSFTSKNVTKNGKIRGTSGCIGRLNVQPSLAPGTLSFIAAFVYADGSGPINASGLSFYFTLADLEVGTKSGVAEKVSTAPTLPTKSTLSPGIEDLGGGAFQPILTGNGSNNPSTISDLGKDVDGAGQRSLTLFYTNQDMLTFTFDAVKAGGDMTGARNFMFLGTDESLAPTSSPTPLPQGEGTCATCVIWGDPHVITFDLQRKRARQHPQREAFFRTRGWRSDELSVIEAGTFWLVRHDKVQIQGRYEHLAGQKDVTALTEIVVGGPFLEGNVLVLQPLNGRATWNGREILPSDQMPSAFTNDLVSAFYHQGAELVKDGTHGPGIEISLPMGVELTVNRWKTSMAVAIKLLGPLPGGQGGQCGDFDGDAGDDNSAVILHANERAAASDFLQRGLEGASIYRSTAKEILGVSA